MLLGLPLAAGEKANITPSGTRNSPSNLDLPKNNLPFRPLDGASSIGGVLDGGVRTALPSVEPMAPDARTQREFIERLDRKRNFLLDDPSADSAADNQPLGSVGRKDDDKLSLSPRRPKTALEKQLRLGSESRKNETTDSESRKRDYGETDNERGSIDLSGLGVSSQNRGIASTLTGIGTNPIDQGLSGFGTTANALELENLDAIRSSLATAGGRGLGLDALSRQRVERYQQLSGEGEAFQRGFGSDPADSGRSRELRSDAMNNLFSPPPVAVRSDLSTLDTAQSPLDVGLARPSASAETRFSGLQPNPYSSIPAVAPPVSPATKFLKEPRPEPPRFRQ